MSEINKRKAESILDVVSETNASITLDGQYTRNSNVTPETDTLILSSDGSMVYATHNGDLIWKETVKKATTEDIHRISELRQSKRDLLDSNKLDMMSNSGQKWKNVSKTTNIKEWKTEVDGNSIKIYFESDYYGTEFCVTAPVEDGSSYKYKKPADDVAWGCKSFSSLESALLYAVNYMKQKDPAIVDKLVRIEELAEQRFMQLPGIGEKTADELVNMKHIRTYKELEHNVNRYVNTRNEECLKEIKSLRESNQKIVDDPYIKEISVKVITENL